MSFYADLHVHSKYSMATSRESSLVPMAQWALRKGLGVVGTGDFTHPVWREELVSLLEPGAEGLWRLKGMPSPSFMLTAEIATVYKKDGRTRKAHHVVCAPDFAAVERLVARLARIGNLAADGRPILKLDARDLLEIVLESCETTFLFPAHIWTPWFSVLGAKSGFDSVEECYGDLAGHIFALETGLSSDPSMNWRVSALDRYRLVSNSDAHSPAKLGREACLFECAATYDAVRYALRTGEGYGGTIEFFPEEGKYHLDGHRACNVCMTPEETRRAKGLCPACGKPVTPGVLQRVLELADRPEPAKPPGAAGFRHFLGLMEVIAETIGVSAASKRVAGMYDGLVSRLGPELSILGDVPIEDIARQGSAALAEAIRRMRDGSVLREAGYDGRYGTIRLFAPGELRGL